MTKSQTKLGFMQKLIALGICLAFALTQVSLAHANSASSVNADGFALVDGQAYTVGVSFMNSSNPDNESMAADFMGETATLTYDSNSQTYSITITTNSPQYIEDITYNGVSATVSEDGTSFTLTGIDSILSSLTIGMVITPMKELGMGEVTALLVIDTDNLPTQITEETENPGEEITPPVTETEDGEENNPNNDEENNNENEDSSSSSEESEENDNTAVNADGFALVDGQAYTVGVSFMNSSNPDNESMAADFMGETATLTYDSNSQTYSITITTNSPQYIEDITYNGVSATVSEDGTSFTLTGIDSILSSLTIGMVITPMKELGMGEVTALLVIDTDNLPTTSDSNSGSNTSGNSGSGSGSTGGSSSGSQNNSTSSGSNKNTGANNNAANSSGSTVAFEAGHTYEVPMSIYKENSTTDLSMANDYFGDTAYVRPSDDLSTLSISFTTNSLDYISSLSYNGTSLSLSGSTFTVTVPYTESNLVLPMDMTIVPMQELGMGEVSADFHFYLTSATDLGTNVSSSATPSSVSSGSGSSLATTGANNIAISIVGALGLVILGGAFVLSKRRLRCE